jgi:acyl dehydratase
MPALVGTPLTRTDFVRYQGASGDMNPIHHDDGFAMGAGFPSVFAVGMLQAGVLGSHLAGWIGPAAIRGLRVQFREQAWPGDVITYTGRVVADHETEVGRRVDLELAATRQTGGVHIRGWASALVPPPAADADRAPARSARPREVGAASMPRVAAPFSMPVERGKIREFARATGSSDPAYFEDEGSLSPPTFLMSAAFWQDDASRAPRGEGGFERLLHGEQEFAFVGEPPRAGVVLTGQARLDRVYEKEGRRGGAMTFQEVVTEYWDADGRTVAEVRNLSIITGRPPIAD